MVMKIIILNNVFSYSIVDMASMVVKTAITDWIYTLCRI